MQKILRFIKGLHRKCKYCHLNCKHYFELSWVKKKKLFHTLILLQMTKFPTNGDSVELVFIKKLQAYFTKPLLFSV